MQLIVFSKYVWVVPLKDKNELVLLMHLKEFQVVQKEKRIKYGLIKVGNFFNSQFKKFLKDNNIETYNEGKSVVGEKFIKTLKKQDF